MKRLTFALGMASVITMGSAYSASAPDYAPIQKDIKILTKIFETSLGGESRSGMDFMMRQSSVEGLYLANQGMLFNLHLPGNEARRWTGFPHAHMAPVPMAPLTPLAPMPAPMPKSSPDPVERVDTPDAIDFEDHEDIDDVESYVEAIVESSMEAAELGVTVGTATKAERDALRAKLAELRKARSQHEKQVEALEEQMETLEDQRDSKDKNAREKARADMEKARESMRKSREQYHNTINKFRAEQGKRWREQVTKTQDELLDTLCNYAASTRRIQNNENVTLIFRDVNEGELRHEIFVIKRSDLVNCAGTTQAPGYLRSKATHYST